MGGTRLRNRLGNLPLQSLRLITSLGICVRSYDLFGKLLAHIFFFCRLYVAFFRTLCYNYGVEKILGGYLYV